MTPVRPVPTDPLPTHNLIRRPRHPQRIIIHLRTDDRVPVTQIRQREHHFVYHEAPPRDPEGSGAGFDREAQSAQHAEGELDHLGGEAVGVAGGDEVDDGADHCFARLGGRWVEVGEVEGVEQGCVPMPVLDPRREAV